MKSRVTKDGLLCLYCTNVLSKNATSESGLSLALLHHSGKSHKPSTTLLSSPLNKAPLNSSLISGLQCVALMNVCYLLLSVWPHSVLPSQTQSQNVYEGTTLRLPLLLVPEQHFPFRRRQKEQRCRMSSQRRLEKEGGGGWRQDLLIWLN